ncbi:unnamed protein product [Paramecium primaurelia]|uniref:Uncharacterized protein n=1 Tax=Paramecium primaurelia TaxID=5886 RepID=A0A8S1LBS5_PARPR|nr:unnamed protein product [Paramecium primaurelia]
MNYMILQDQQILSNLMNQYNTHLKNIIKQFYFNNFQIKDYQNTSLETKDSFILNKNILPISLKQYVKVSKQGQRILLKSKLKILLIFYINFHQKMLNIYILQSIIQEEEYIFKFNNLKK